MKKILEKIFPSDSNKRIKACEKELRAIASFEPALEVYTEDDFKKNLIAIRIEGRIALPIYYPAGWAYGDKGPFSGS